jgi:hypothetical protein
MSGRVLRLAQKIQANRCSLLGETLRATFYSRQDNSITDVGRSEDAVPMKAVDQTIALTTPHKW